MNPVLKPYRQEVEVTSPQFLPNAIATLARARLHLSNERPAIAAQLMSQTEARLEKYYEMVAKREMRRV